MKPWLWIPPKWAHNLSDIFLKSYGQFIHGEIPKWRSFRWRGIEFANRLGIAGGVDKNGDYIDSLWSLGSGFLEIGTVTPRPQDPNPGKVMDRDNKELAIWNKMGFPGKGADYVQKILENSSKTENKKTPIFINIGKNRSTRNEDAYQDYLYCMTKLSPLADAFVINISSPNTKDLRKIQEQDALHQFLKQLVGKQRKPLLLKLSPDVTEVELSNILNTSADLGIDGWVLNNTTVSRPPGLPFPSEGGMSGRPLAEISKRQLKLAISILGPKRRDKLIISVGGVLTPENVKERLDLGADLVEVYAALIFDGPFFFKKTASYFNT
ncbi:MAG: dihydroorotate dehydrogenase [Proteobacteria bacterium SG_bin7]|nr:MAG: dihydroorotate dehydrogenase [Proteobacteria bacterium SG_bin7]